MQRGLWCLTKNCDDLGYFDAAYAWTKRKEDKARREKDVDVPQGKPSL